MPHPAYAELVTLLKETALFGSIGSLLGWDERVQMPARGADHRANQASLLARKVHEQFTSPRIGELLATLEATPQDGDSDEAVNVRETRRQYDRATKLPPALVEEMAKTEVLAQQAWAEARQKSDFPAFKPWLEKWVVLKKKQAACYGHTGHVYNALLEDFEPGETAENLSAVFDALRAPLVDLIGRIVSSGRPAPLEILERSYPVDAQARLARDAAAAVGFDFAAGRLDVSTHPFCSGIGPGDTRMTTRYDEAYFGDAFFGVLHETGHGLYDQGLPAEHFGTPRGEAVSLGIHESQSRMWENLVGRSRAFWQFFMPRARAAFPHLADVSDDDWFRAVNDVRPSLIRTESDEATYNLHILLRFELEKALLTGDLAVADLPAEWNRRMKEYLGVDVPDDRRGVLQDIHWSGGALGYFPTYTLGNLYAAQFFEQARADLGDLDSQFAAGQFAPLLGWLRTHIHSQGKRYTPARLVKQVTGKPLSAEPLLRHLRSRAAEVYGV
ncbi:MAG TPA: carboxypeptidase M32 [Tepidisphaeraceae bacterium]|nr:carboxypeptidase M32 [Tepidisphaeraceae bacterium]